ncbi:MAG: hypothetical protein M3495_04110 [Pseudomonadota bacterium]|nr:hypothetical protein [Gammaproteobacteria bacterium]MDQ3580839.1 hypothetical protein [Pseudomonadota bacterium]
MSRTSAGSVIGNCPRSLTEWYARLGEILDGRRELLARASTWGDGLYLVRGT